ncbi:hypothetical protein [Cohaesibacter marisflavi]|nr:hypothetical protein [Cohaesibacter marisflavi]
MMKTPDQGNVRNLGVLDDTYVTKGDELELNQKKKESAENPSETVVIQAGTDLFYSKFNKIHSWSDITISPSESYFQLQIYSPP